MSNKWRVIAGVALFCAAAILEKVAWTLLPAVNDIIKALLPKKA